MRKLFSIVIALSVLTINMVNAQVKKAPAYPLITHNTYFSIWSFGDKLNESSTKHWTGKDQSLLGLIKVDGTSYRFMGKETAVYHTILAAADETPYECKYTENEPKSEWTGNKFDETDWKTASAPFTDDKQQAKTLWTSKNIWVRRSFEVNDADIEKLILKIHHDDNVEVYLNGEKVYEKTGWTNDFNYIPIKNYLKKGTNILAVHCANTAGGAWLDAGLVNEVRTKSGGVLLARQKSVEVNATQTVYDFECVGVDLKVTFTSPLLMNDLKLFARPVSYISYNVKTNDGRNHDVKIFLSASSSIAVNAPAQQVIAQKDASPNLSILKAGTIEQPVLKKKGDDLRIDWGYMYVATPKSNNELQYVTPQQDATASFLNNISATNTKQGSQLALNTIINFGAVGPVAKEKFVELGYDDLYSVQYFNRNLKPWWKLDGIQTIEKELNTAATDYVSVMKKCDAFNKSMYSTAIKAGGKNYADLCVLAYRQSIAAHQLLKSPQGDILFLSKENFSNGSINTVDVTYPWHLYT